MTGWMTASQAEPGPAGLPAPPAASCSRVMLEFEADRLPGPLRQHAVGGQQPGHRFFQPVVQALRRGAGVFGAARLRQRAEHRIGHLGAPLRQVAFQPPRPAERLRQPQPPVLKPVTVPVVIGPGVLAGQFLSDPGQVGQAAPAAAAASSSPSAASRTWSGSVRVQSMICAAHDSEKLPSASAAAITGWASSRCIQDTR